VVEDQTPQNLELPAPPREGPATKPDAGHEHHLSNGLVESTNTKIRVLTRMAFGFKSPQALIALAMLNLGGYCPPLPGRKTR